MVNKGIKLRLYPNKEQEKQLNNMFGNNRFLWNLLLEMQQVRYKLFGLSCMSAYTMDSLVTQLKKVYPFLKLSDSTAFQKLTKSLNTSYWNFIKDPHKYGMPKFKYNSKYNISTDTILNSEQIRDIKRAQKTYFELKTNNTKSKVTLNNKNIKVIGDFGDATVTEMKVQHYTKVNKVINGKVVGTETESGNNLALTITYKYKD